MPESVAAPGFSDPDKTLSGPIIGIIYPPPEVRNIVDKTAIFVARNGFEFENKIQQSEKGNKKFSFLNPGDPYHAYYQHKVKEIKEGEAAQPSFPGLKNLSISSVAQKQQELLKQVTEQQFVPKDPPPDFEFIADPPSISALDLDIVKLTAQFVARNGRQFLTNLMNREQRNYQFDFLRPQHALFQYFTKLLEQYTKILIPPKGLVDKLRSELDVKSEGPSNVLEQVKYRANWLKHEEAQKRREEEKIERERVAYAQIDWHDFVVVEVVEYQPYESGNFPPPTTPEEVGARILMEERYQEDDNDIEMQIESDEEQNEQQVPHSNVKLSIMENRVKDNTTVQDMDEASSEEDQPSTSKSAPVLPPPSHDKVIVRKYDPKQAGKISKPPVAAEEYLISPITGEKVPASQVAEHMRITLLDPRWVEQRDRQMEKAREENVYAGGAAIEATLKKLAERRTDIFGVGDEEAAIGKKLGEEEPRKDDRVTWDGHTSSVEAATRAAARNVSLEDQIHQIHKVKGLLPDEEKEKIGPKPMSTVSAPPKPPSIPPPHQMNIPQNMPHHPSPMPPMMMPQRMPPMRPPMMPPPFPVPGFPVAMPPLAPAPPVMEMESDEPLNKKPRQEDHLIPEDVFMQQHKSPITIQVQVPNSTDKPEWKLNGQLLSINIGLSDTIQKLKQKVQEETDMPPAKQKISHDGIFFKDSNTCAYYNLLSGITVHLQIKERGGRKK